MRASQRRRGHWLQVCGQELNRSIADEQVGVARYEACIKIIEDRESVKQCTDHLLTTDSDDSAKSQVSSKGSDSSSSSMELPSVHREHYGPEKDVHFEKPAMQLGSRSVKYDSSQVAKNRQDEKSRCEAYEHGIINTIQKQGASKLIAAVSSGIPTLLFDSGTYRHIWGTDMVKAGLVHNIQALAQPEVVETAAGQITLKQSGTVMLRNICFNGIINQFMRISLISTGELYVQNKWQVTGENWIITCQPPPELCL